MFKQKSKLEDSEPSFGSSKLSKNKAETLEERVTALEKLLQDLIKLLAERTI